MVQSKISSTLFELIKTIRDSLIDFKSFKNNEVVHLVNMSLKTSRKIVSYDQGIKQSEGSSEYIVKKDTYWKDFKAYFNRLSSKYPIFSTCLAEIKDEFHLSDEQAESNLNSLLQFVLFKNELELIDSTIIEIVAVFINDLNKTAPLWNIKLFVDGLWLNEEVIKLSNNILIRKPIDSDFDFIQPVSLLNIVGPNEPDSCASIIEFAGKFDSEKKVNQYVDKIITSLRIFNLGSIEIKSRIYMPNSILTRNPISSNQSSFSQYKYELTSTNSENLNQFINYFLEFLPAKSLQKDIHELNPIYIGIDRYMEAISKSVSQEKRITSTITALEALLLKGNERSELSHRLSQRVSYLLRYFNEHPVKVYNTIKRAYDIRSTYIHGSILPPDGRKDLADIQNKVCSAVRRVLLIFIEFTKTIKKDELISKIDNAIIDESAHKKVSQEISKLELLKLTSDNTGFINMNSQNESKKK
ncbi:MAG: HEPN domain-containing protein [Bacteroidetes bacterium]|nr:HEPN domain-containing protein [Bacteroidota bacterium]